MDNSSDTAVQEKPKQQQQEHAPLPASDQDLAGKHVHVIPAFALP